MTLLLFLTKLTKHKLVLILLINIILKKIFAEQSDFIAIIFARNIATKTCTHCKTTY